MEVTQDCIYCLIGIFVDMKVVFNDVATVVINLVDCKNSNFVEKRKILVHDVVVCNRGEVMFVRIIIKDKINKLNSKEVQVSVFQDEVVEILINVSIIKMIQVDTDHIVMDKSIIIRERRG